MKHILDLSERELAESPGIKLVCLDIDGTLLYIGGNYSLRGPCTASTHANSVPSRGYKTLPNRSNLSPC